MRGGERIPGVPVASQEEALSTGKARGTPGSCHHSQIPQMSQSIPGKPVFPELPRLSSRGSTHTMVARGAALWESLVGKYPEKTSRESHRSHDPREGKRDTAATDREENPRAYPHSRRGITPLGDSRGTQDPCQHWRGILRIRHRLHTRSQGPASPGEESREAPEQLHGDWPFLRPPERVPEVPVVSRQHLPQLEKIQEVLPSRRDEALFR